MKMLMPTPSGVKTLTTRRSAGRARGDALVLRRQRAFTARQYLAAAVVAAVVSAAGFGGYLYYRSNSPSQLAIKAEIALQQHDTTRAIAFLQRALTKNPSGAMGVELRDLMGRAMIDGNRESDARSYLTEALARDPRSVKSLDLLAQSYVHTGLRVLAQAPKPLTDVSIHDVLGVIDEQINAMKALPQTPRDEVAQAQLQRLTYMILEDQRRRAQAGIAAAKLSGDAVAIDKATQQAAAIADPAPRRDRAMKLLEDALAQDPHSVPAGQFLVQYEYQDHDYDKALALYEKLKADGVTSAEMTITGANIMIADAQRQPGRKARFADAEKELQGYLDKHPDGPAESHVLVAIGQTLLEQDKIPEATAMAQRATAKFPGDLDAQILLVNSKLREKKTAEALALVSPLSNSDGNVPQVWYLLGQANSDAGDLVSAENAYKKALALNPDYTAARRALLTNDIRAQETDAAVLLASQELKDDHYFILAWEVTAQDLERHGQADRARSFLATMAADPQLPQENRPEVISLLLKYGLPGDAEKLLATLPPNDEGTLRLRSQVAAAGGHLAEARTLLAKDVAANPGDMDLRLRYAELLLQSGLPADARAQLDAVSAPTPAGKVPPSAPNLLRAARGYLRLRLPDQALAAIKQALAMQPQSVDALELEQQATAMRTGAPAPQALSATVNPDQATTADTIRLANAALARKDNAGALSLARGGLAKNTGSAELHEIAARALAALGKYDQAVDEIETAANSHKESPAAFAVFVELFPTPDAALKGMGYGNRMLAINPALGNWAMGRLAEISGDLSTPPRYFEAGIKAASNTLDPGAAKDVLYRAILDFDAARKDTAALAQHAATFAREPAFTIGIRWMAADQLRLLGDNAGSREQLDQLAARLTGNVPANILVNTAQRYLALNLDAQAFSLMDKNLAGHQQDAPFLDAYAALLQSRDADRALKIRQELVALDGSNPQYRVALALAQVAAGDEPGGFATLDAARSLGETGRQLATATRTRLLISLGLLHAAADELAAKKTSPNTDDFASMLAIGQGWAQLSKPQDARKILAAIPPYAAEYPTAVATLAGLDSEAGNADAAVAAVKKIPALDGELFQIYLHAGKADAALDLAKKQLAGVAVDSPAGRAWTIRAATAARETAQYAVATDFLNTLDAPTRKNAAFDIALLELLQNKTAAAAKTAELIPDTAPTFNRSTILLLAHATPAATASEGLLETGAASTVYAYLADHLPATGQTLPAGLEKNARVIPGDVASLLTDLAVKPKQAAANLRQVALIQRLLEAGWITPALAQLHQLSADAPPLKLCLVQEHQADIDLRRFAAAEKLRAAVAALVKAGGDVPPSARILLAAAAAEKDDAAGAIADLEPLAALNRPSILTTLATLHEKLGQLDQAIALHRKVRQLDPGNILAANNLAYTLVEAHPNDKAALAEAKSAIQFAIGKAPQVAGLQDTLAWIEILSGETASGTRRLAKNLPALRLNAAVHYHLGVGYARLGKTDLARLHLQNVSYLAQSKTPIPELPLAAEALKALASAQK